jgi:glycosyltransferase involved in cell wall biosynthesis
MKILVLTPYFYPHIGGSERYIEELYGELMKQNPEVEVDVLAYNTNGVKKVERHKNFNIYRIGCFEILPNQFVLPNYFELISLLKQLKKKNYSHVNAHTRFFDTAWWGWFVAKFFGAKSILTDHCASHPQHKNLIVRIIARLVDRVVMPLLFKLYGQVVVVSQATRDFWVKNVKQAKNIVVVPNSVTDSLLIKKQVDGHKISVRFVGRNVATKGAGIFDEVAKELKLKYPEVLFERISGLSHDRVMCLLEQTTILVHPSIHHEGLPTVILEAGLAGCAVVATDVGGTKELIRNGKSGLLVKPTVSDVQSGVKKLLIESSKAKTMGQNLRQRVLENYSWTETAKKYNKLLFR